MPGIVHINNQAPLKKGDGPICLVLVPTRELALQIATVADEFGKSSNIKNVCVYGGASRAHQINLINKGLSL